MNVNLDQLTEPHRFELISLCIDRGAALLPVMNKLSDEHRFELLHLLSLDWKEMLSQCGQLDWGKIDNGKGAQFLKGCIQNCDELAMKLGFIAQLGKLGVRDPEKIQIAQNLIVTLRGYDWIPLLTSMLKLIVEDEYLGLEEKYGLTMAHSIQSKLCCNANLKMLNAIKIEEVGKEPFLKFMELFLQRIVNKLSHRDALFFRECANTLIKFPYPEEVQSDMAELFKKYSLIYLAELV